MALGTYRVTSLNSNLILLIPPSPAVYNTFYSTLNSNLILLIRCTAGCLSVLRIHPFKFQSDSINTTSPAQCLHTEVIL